MCAVFHPNALNTDFNISTTQSKTVMELAKVIWEKIHHGQLKFSTVSDPSFDYDVQKRIPDVSKASRVLGVTCDTSLSDMLDEVIPWIQRAIDEGQL